MKILKILTALTVLLSFNSLLSAQDGKSSGLTQQILSAKDNQQAFLILQQAKEGYFKDAKFNEFYDLLKELPAKNKSLTAVSSYFCGLDRYQQLKYLEEKQSWDEYFSKGNDYRQDITSGLAEAIKSTAEKEALGIYARILLWQFHQDQQDAFAEDSLNSLLAAVKIYAEGSADSQVIKDAADKLQAYEQKGKAKELYKIYINKIINANLKDEELKAMAAGFFKDANLELAQTVYDAYVDRILKSLPKEKAAAELIEIARSFAYKDGQVNDPAYAEKIFEKLELLSGKAAFDEQLAYLRAYNLERARDYSKAKAQYSELLGRFPGSAYSDKINFKLGIISVYILKGSAGRPGVLPEALR